MCLSFDFQRLGEGPHWQVGVATVELEASRGLKRGALRVSPTTYWTPPHWQRRGIQELHYLSNQTRTSVARGLDSDYKTYTVRVLVICIKMMFFSPDDRLLDGNKPAVDYGTSSQPGPHNEETFGDTERRRDIEKALLRKLDLRTAFLVLMYIMNYVSEL